MTLGEVVRQMVAHLHERQVTMPFENEAPWHQLFYRLKREQLEGKPRFLETLRFDWDGPYPKCRQLSEFLHALHWNACVSASNPTFMSISLPDDIARHWKAETENLEPEQKEFISTAVQLASEEFQEAQPSEMIS